MDEVRQRHLDSWKNARTLGEEPDLEWSFVWYRFRSMLLWAVKPEDLGGQYFYEPIREFDSLLEILRLRQQLEHVGAPEETLLEIEVGFNVFDSIYRAPNGRLQLPSDGDVWRGRHNVVIVGSDDQGEALVFRNTWGQRWGDGGYGYMSREYFERHADIASVSSFAHVGVKPESLSLDVSSMSEAEWLDEYLRRRPSSTEQRLIRGNQHEFVVYRMVSVDWNCAVDVIEIWALERRWAWAHLFHPSGYDDRKSVIRELFVAPTARRRGLASTLVEAASAIATDEGSERIVIEVQEADGHSQGLSRAQAFAGSLGFTAEQVAPEVRPVVIYRASRNL